MANADEKGGAPSKSRRFFLGLPTTRKKAKARQEDDAPIPMPPILNVSVTRRNLLPPVLSNEEDVEADADNDTSVDVAAYPLERQLADVVSILGIKPNEIMDESSPIYKRMMDIIGRPIDRRKFNQGVVATANPIPIPVKLPTDIGDIADTATNAGSGWLHAVGVKIARAIRADYHIKEEREEQLTDFFNSIRHVLEGAGSMPNDSPILKSHEEVESHVKSGLSAIIQMRMQQLSMVQESFRGLTHEQIREAMEVTDIYDYTDGMLDDSELGNDFKKFGIVDYGGSRPEKWEFKAGSVRQQIRRYLDTALHNDLVDIAQRTYRQTGVVLTNALPKSILKAAELEKITPFTRLKRTIPPTPQEQAEEDELIYGEDVTIAKVLEDKAFYITKSQDNGGYIIGAWALEGRVKSVSTFFDSYSDGAGGADKELRLLDRLRYAIGKQYPEAIDALEWLHTPKAQEDLPDSIYDEDRGHMKVMPYVIAPEDKAIIFVRSGDYAFKISNSPSDNEDINALRQELEAFFASKKAKEEEYAQRHIYYGANSKRGEKIDDFGDENRLKARKTERKATIAKRLEEPERYPHAVAYVEALGRVEKAKENGRKS